MLIVKPYVQSYLAREYQNDAEGYGVRVLHGNAPRYRAVGVHHLTPDENRGLNHVFLMVVDDVGKAIRGIPVAWEWVGQKQMEESRPVVLDKPEPEPMGNIPMGRGQVVTVWVAGSGPSDRVSGLSTLHPDEGVGNTRYHHSFLVVFRVGGASPYTEPTEVDLVAVLYELNNARDAIANATTMIVISRPGGVARSDSVPGYQNGH